MSGSGKVTELSGRFATQILADGAGATSRATTPDQLDHSLLADQAWVKVRFDYTPKW